MLLESNYRDVTRALNSDCSANILAHRIQEIWKGGGSDMKINRGRVREGDAPPPARSAEAFGGRALSDTDYLSSLKLGRKTKKWWPIMVGGGVEWNRTYLSAFHI